MMRVRITSPINGDLNKKVCTNDKVVSIASYIN